MLDWLLHLRRASVVRSDAEYDAAVMCIGVALLALGIALL